MSQNQNWEIPDALEDVGVRGGFQLRTTVGTRQHACHDAGTGATASPEVACRVTRHRDAAHVTNAETCLLYTSRCV